MFDVPLDAWYVWLGLAVASSATFGLASAMPAAPPPDASGAAETVDGVAASPYAAVGEHPLPNAEAVRIQQDTLSLRGPGGVEHAGLGYGPVAPARQDEELAALLRGEPPEAVFDSPADFQAAIRESTSRDPRWERTDRLVVRRVTWEGTDAVLVG